ncbi:MAG: diaminopimelate epimerase [Bacteroidota bacterium]|nr:diaminopimelate epimerase [Bacteroidota bacterium]
MSKMTFYKYQGTGNDFIILDNRNWSYTALTTERVKSLCDRRTGIGADGLMLMNTKAGYDFEMKYYNADGRESSMCGNGGRCMVKFAYDLGMHKNSYHFLAIDGPHEAEIDDNGIVNLKMKDVQHIRDYHGDSILDTGSPHYVKIIGEVMDYDVYRKGMEIRYSPEFAKEGINVNFVEQRKPDEITVRTYERGVEDETLSFGTGVTASALGCYHNECGYNDVTVVTRGGKLTVKFDRSSDESYHNIWLCGPAVKVFEGTIDA